MFLLLCIIGWFLKASANYNSLPNLDLHSFLYKNMGWKNDPKMFLIFGQTKETKMFLRIFVKIGETKNTGIPKN